jgi:tetratricopeptide (TPR) repeat protein
VYAASKQWFDRSRAAVGEVGKPGDEVWVTLNLATVAIEDGEFQTSLELSLEALAILESQNSTLGQALANADAGIAYAFMGDFQNAERHMERSLFLRSKIDSPMEMSRAWLDKGRLAYERGDLEDAIRLFKEAQPAFEGLSHASLALETTRGLSEAFVDLDRMEEALQQVETAEVFALPLGNIHDATWMDRIRAVDALKRGDAMLARELASDALQAIVKEELKQGYVEGVILAAEILLADGRKDSAQDLMGDLWASIEACGYGLRPSRIRRIDRLGLKKKKGTTLPLAELTARAMVRIL